MKKGIVQRYTDAKGKKNLGVSAMKMGVESVGALAGGGAGALAGIASPFVGIALLFAGQFFGDETGMLKVAGAGMIGYGIANATVNRSNAKTASLNGLGEVKGNVSQRLIDYKDNLLNAFYLDKLFKKEADSTKTQSEDLGSAPYLDTSGLDVFNDFNEQFAMRQANQEVEQENDYSHEYDDDDDDDEQVRGIYYEPSQNRSLDDKLIEEEIDFALM